MTLTSRACPGDENVTGFVCVCVCVWGGGGYNKQNNIQHITHITLVNVYVDLVVLPI